MKDKSNFGFFLIGIYLVFSIYDFNVLAQIECDPKFSVEGEYGQCIPICGEGLVLENDSCVKQNLGLLEEHWLGIGVVIAALATGIGILFTWQDKKKEREKRTQELIQTYDEELREIAQQEKNLNTKLDCALYVERYLDTLEKIATLSLVSNFQGKVSDFFENNFAYGIELWRWYQKNVVNIRGEFFGKGIDLGPLWKTFPEFKKEKAKLRISDEGLKDIIFKEFAENYYNSTVDQTDLSREPFSLNWFNKSLERIYKKDTEFEINSFKDYLFNFYNNERWREFRTWCNQEPSGIGSGSRVIPFLNDFEFLQTTQEKEKQDENGKGKYRILPDVLYEQYEQIPEENGLTKGELVEIIRGFGKDLAKITEMEKNLGTDEQCAIYAEQFLDTLEEITSLYRSDMIPRRAANYFENKFSYGINLWEWYYEKVLNYSDLLWNSLWYMDDKNPIKKDSRGKIDKEKSKEIKERNFKKFVFELLNDPTKRDSFLDNPVTKESFLRKLEEKRTSFLENPISEEDYDGVFDKISEENSEVLKQIYQLNLETQKLSQKNLINFVKNQIPKETKKERLQEFISKTINNERWRDFRWWCKSQELTPFEEDENIGLVLPLRMWEVHFEKSK